MIASIFFFFHTYTFQESLGYQETGPGFWPRLILVGMVIITAIILARAFMEAKRKGKSAPPRSNKAFILMIGLLMVYILAIHVIGFLPASLLMLIGFIRLLGEQNKLVILGASFGLVAAIYLIFAKIMVSPLPRGVSVFKELSYFLY
jgi:hypothetical protein